MEKMKSKKIGSWDGRRTERLGESEREKIGGRNEGDERNVVEKMKSKKNGSRDRATNVKLWEE